MTKRILVTDGELKRYPALYKWAKINPKNFKVFFAEMVEKMWDGNKEEALRMMDDFFKNSGKR